MNQPDLFAPLPRASTAPSPGELAARRRDTGIGRSADHAQRIDPAWQERAVCAVALYARAHQHFQAEDARAAAEAAGLASPADPRAWGSVMQRAAREGIAKADGYAPSSSSNCSPKVRWFSLVFA